MANERRLATTLVELADTLVDDFDVVDLLQTLTERSVELLEVDEAGLMLADESGRLRVMASTSERGRLLELFELQEEEGPCLDCFRSGRASGGALEAHAARWPRLAPEAQAVGFRAIHALPMRLRNRVIGALNLFSSDSRALTTDDLAVGQALADVATIGILQHRTLREMQVVIEQLRHALNSRVTIEQAKGVVAERGQVDMPEAFALIRRYARQRRTLLHDTAAGVIAGAISLGDLRSSSPDGP